MNIGVNMLLWATCVNKEHIAALRAIKEAGADGVEIPIMEGEVGAYRELGKLLDDIGLKRTSSMAFVTPDVNPVSDDPACRQAAVDNLKWLIECAYALGAPVICGPLVQTIGAFTGNGPTDVERTRAADVLRSVAEEARQAGVTLAMEPLNRFECYMLNTLADGAALTDRIGHPNVGVLFDTFHANIEEKDPVGVIRKYGRVIKHFHCSANDRGIPGQDHIDWQGTFKALHDIGYDGWLVIEAFGRALPGLAAATKIWRDMFDDALDVARVGVPFVRETWEKAGR
jgi:D-psicose/D-tagatose/L-ribulose 3-epimerase